MVDSGWQYPRYRMNSRPDASPRDPKKCRICPGKEMMSELMSKVQRSVLTGGKFGTIIFYVVRRMSLQGSESWRHTGCAVILAFYLVMFAISIVLGWLLRLPYPDVVALTFGASSRNM